MQFVVEIRRMQTPQGPPQMEMALAKQMFQQFVNGQADPRIKAVYPHAGERSGTLIVEVDSADELNQVMGQVPVLPLCEVHYHPVMSLQAGLAGVEEAERRLAATAGATTGT